MLRELPVSDLMTRDVLTLDPDMGVSDAMRRLVAGRVSGAPVVGADGKLVGILSSADLIIEEARLHFPTIVNFLGVNVTFPWHDKELDESVAKALGEFVSDAMTRDVVTIRADATIEDAATLMHDKQVSRLPVVDTIDRVVGILTRSDILRAMVLGLDEPTPEQEKASYDPGDELEEMLGERAAADLDLAAREERAADLRGGSPSAAEGSDDDVDYGTDVGNI